MEKKEDNKRFNKKEERKVMIQENFDKINENIDTFFKKTFQNTISAFVLSLISTTINFTCNIPLLRKVSKESYGVVRVYFELAFTLVNFIPRETLRRASQKFCPDKDSEKENDKLTTLSQISYLFLFASSILSIFIFLSFMLFTDSTKLHENYIQLIIYIICALFEMLIEPVVLYMNLNMENKFLPINISSISRIISNTIFIAFFNMDLWSFTLARIIGSSVYTLSIFFLGICKYKLNFFNFFPKNLKIWKSLIFDKSSNNGTNLIYLREILFQFIKLNLLNLILSECQNLVLSFILKSSDEEKSDYSFIVQNYSRISKFLLEPIIDAFYNLVNKIKYIERKRGDYFKQENENDINQMKDDDDSSKELELKRENIHNQKMEELVEKDNNAPEKEEAKETKKEINYDLSIKLLQFFIKIFVYIGILMIPYYILIGTEIMGYIYGEKWQNNNIDKIGNCYSYFVIIKAISDLIKNFGNSANDARQMNLSYISLIVNAIFLSIFMYFLSKWDICGLIISNVLSAAFLTNINLYIIFCGKSQNIKLKIKNDSTIKDEIEVFINKCFISLKSIVATFILIIIGSILKKIIASHASASIVILSMSFIGLVNVFFIYKFENNNFMRDLNIIKTYSNSNE